MRIVCRALWAIGRKEQKIARAAWAVAVGLLVTGLLFKVLAFALLVAIALGLS